MNTAWMLSTWLLVCTATTSAVELRGVAQQNPEAQENPTSRRDRFPSVDERVKIYMSNWYEPPCRDEEKHHFNVKGGSVEIGQITVKQDIRPDYLLWLNEAIVRDCARTKQEVNLDRNNSITLPTERFVDEAARFNMQIYCVDVLEAFEFLHQLPLNEVPLLMQFGDMKHSHEYGSVSLPHFKKFRSATDNLQSTVSSDTTTCTSTRRPLATAHGADTLQPIIWKLASHRHYKHLPNVAKQDTPWHLKKNMAVWRGQLTGALEFFDPDRTVQQNCERMNRCRLVLEHGNSTLVDAKLTTTRNRLPNDIDGVEMVQSKVPIKYQMQYKGIIMLEGNDVASGLKWAMLSQSVVLMPKPMHTSWAMEELLEPWVHYVPLNDDATDVEAKMQWVVDHDEEARRIAERSTLWIEDLVYHPDAAREDRLVKREMIRRYQAHFVAEPSIVAPA